MYILLKNNVLARGEINNSVSIIDNNTKYSFNVKNVEVNKLVWHLNNGLDTRKTLSRNLLYTILSIKKQVPDLFFNIKDDVEYNRVVYIKSLLNEVDVLNIDGDELLTNLMNTKIYTFADSNIQRNSVHPIESFSNVDQLFSLNNSDILLLEIKHLKLLKENLSRINARILLYSKDRLGPVILPGVHLCKKCLYKQSEKFILNYPFDYPLTQNIIANLVDNTLLHISSQIYLYTYDQLPIPFSMIWIINNVTLNIESKNIYKQCLCNIQEEYNDKD